MSTLVAHSLLQLRVGFRDWAYLFTTIFLPAGIYWFFAVPESFDEYVASYLICSFSAFSFFGVVFFQYSIKTAHEGSRSWSHYLRTLPVSPAVLLASRLLTSLIFAVASCTLIYAVGVATTPTDMTGWLFLEVLFRLALASLPFLLFGLLVGSLCSTRAVVPVANFLHLVLSFAGGLWKPPNMLPEVLRKICDYLPTYHYGRVVWDLVDSSQPLEWWSIAYLVGFGAGCLICLRLTKGSWA